MPTSNCHIPVVIHIGFGQKEWYTVPTPTVILPPTGILQSFLQFSADEDFKCASSIAGKLLDTYITDGLRLAWMMVTRIPPMVAIEPTAFDPQSTILEDYHESEVVSQSVISLRPTLFFSYEGEVAVQGILTLIPHSEKLNSAGELYLW